MRARSVTCQLKPTTPNQRHVPCGAGIPAHAVTRVRRSTRACCARAMPRQLWSVKELPNGTAPARGLSRSVHARFVTRKT